MSRDDFPETTKRVVAERAAYLCSNPECRALTVAPNSDPERSTTSGVAAHVSAASPGGPRYDADQSPADRRHISNAIWLCHSCSDRVDKDPVRFTRGVLQEWKESHELLVATQGVAPSPPGLRLKTSEALSLLPQVSEQDHRRYREHTAEVSNSGDTPIRNLRLHLRLPEVVERISLPSPAGIAVAGERFGVRVPVRVVGGAIVGGAELIVENCLRFFVSELAPGQTLRFQWMAAGPVESATHGDGIGDAGGRRTLFHFLRGRFHYAFHSALLTKTFWYVLVYDRGSRALTLGRQLRDEELDAFSIANPRPEATGEYWG